MMTQDMGKGGTRRVFPSVFGEQDASRPSAPAARLRPIAMSHFPVSGSLAQTVVQNEAIANVDQPEADATAGMTKTFLPRGLLSPLYPLLAEIWQLLDIVVVAGTLYALARAFDIVLSDKYLALTVVTAVLMLFVYSWSDLFYRLRTRTLAQETRRLLRAWANVLGLLLVLGYLTDTMHEFLHEFPRRLILLWAAIAFVVQLLIHVVTRKTLHALRRRGYNIRSALVVGCGSPLANYARFIDQNPWLGIKVEGYVAEPSWLAETSSGACKPFNSTEEYTHVDEDVTVATGDPPDHTDAAGRVGEALRHLGGLADVNRLVNELSVNEIYVTLPLERSADAEGAMRALVNVPVDVNWLPDFSLAHLLSTRTDELGDHPLILLSDSRIDRHGQLVKRVEDMVLSGILLVLFSPLLVAITLAVKVSSPGPILFKQQRHGLGGRTISVWKFRTMRVTPGFEIAKQAVRRDERITAVGRWLRRWSLDELPQLFNVLQGRMSLVGPRPHPLWLNDQFSKIVVAYMQRHRVKPGLTGWAQVHGYRGETDTTDKMEQRLKHDLYYITHWSPWLDLKIIALTIPAVLLGKNAH